MVRDYQRGDYPCSCYMHKKVSVYQRLWSLNKKKDNLKTVIQTQLDYRADFTGGYFKISSQNTSQIVLLGVITGIVVKDFPDNHPIKGLQKMLSF